MLMTLSKPGTRRAMSDIVGILTAEELELLQPWAQRRYQRAVEKGHESTVLFYYEMAQRRKEIRRLRDDIQS